MINKCHRAVVNASTCPCIMLVDMALAVRPKVKREKFLCSILNTSMNSLMLYKSLNPRALRSCAALQRCMGLRFRQNTEVAIVRGTVFQCSGVMCGGVMHVADRSGAGLRTGTSTCTGSL